MNHIFKIAQYLSLDVALGSVGSSVLAVHVVGAKLPISYWFILPLCVWIIYTSDHLLDAYKLKEKAILARHSFHYKHWRSISVFLGLAVVSSLILVLKLDEHIIVYGFCIYFFILGYLLSNHFINRIFKVFPREFIIALGYMAGTWGIPLLSRYSFISRSDLLFLLNHFLIILAIPLLFSIYEYEADTIGGFISFATTFGIKIAEFSVLGVLVLSTLISTYSFLAFHQGLSLLLLGMTILLLSVLVFRKKLTVNENYRTISDSVNFLPFFLLV